MVQNLSGGLQNDSHNQIKEIPLLLIKTVHYIMKETGDLQGNSTLENMFYFSENILPSVYHNSMNYSYTIFK